MIDVKENEDGTFTISWDENDPTESMFNDWTEQDFINALTDYLQSLEESGEVDINQVTEAVNQINDHIEEEFFIDQTPEEVQQDINTLYDWYSIKKEAIDEYLNFDSKNVQESNYEGFNQGPEDYKLSQDRTLPPPPYFPLFP